MTAGPGCFTALATACADRATGRRNIDELRHDIGKYQAEAFAEYQRQTGAQRKDAEQAVLLMANHVIHVAKERWFTHGPAQKLIIRECVLWLRGSTDIASRPAHLYWQRWWKLQRAGVPSSITDMKSTTEAERAMGLEFWTAELLDAEDKWRAAWETFLINEGIPGI